MPREYIHPVNIYYEDTDFSGLVYHANYLKFCERAREHMIGIPILVELYRDKGIGFVVYKAELTYKDAAAYGDELEVRSTAARGSDYRLTFNQDIYRKSDNKLLVKCVLELVCVDAAKKMVQLPDVINDLIG
jgi:tol-pal system-associated acyl-CoA thioesterase